MSSTHLTAELFLCGVYDYCEEAFDMQHILARDELVGGISPNPTYPDIVSLDMQNTFNELFMYTNNLRELAAPRELCVQKALELISSRENYVINLETFRMELLSEVLAEIGEEDVNALISGIRCICDYLLSNFDKYTQLNAEFFPYEFYCLHQGRYLILSKITFDATLPTFRPATVIKPAYTYPEVQIKNRADYFTKADQCLIL